MTPAQKIELRRSEVRQRLNQISGLEGDAFTAEVRGEAETLQSEYRDLEVRHRAAVIAGDVAAEAGTTTPAASATEDRERLELRQRASFGRFLVAALRGQAPDGAEGELLAAVGAEPGTVPLELFDVPTETRAETRADAATGAPGTTGLNLDPLRPRIYARSVIPRLGIAMPRVKSGGFATATLSTGLSAGAMAAGAARESTAAAFTAKTTTPHRISARLSIRVEDVATVGVANFETILRQNLMLAMADELDRLGLNGDGQGANPLGLLAQLTDPDDAADAITWGGFVALAAGGIDGGPWAEGLGDVKLLVNAETQRKAETTFQSGTGTDTPGELSAAAYLRQHSGGFFASRRMPATASNLAAAVRVRAATAGLVGVDAMRLAVCPVWDILTIDDIYSDSASGTRHVTIHHLIGDVLIEQPDAFEQVSVKLA